MYDLDSVLLQIMMPFPSGPLVYDFRLDDGGISKTTAEEDEEEEKKKIKVRSNSTTKALFQIRVKYMHRS